jgi:hypothetical protein
MTAPSLAGPCTQDIERLQAQVDARIDAVAGAGPAGPESNAARLHREPTPGSIAAAEQRLGEGSPWKLPWRPWLAPGLLTAQATEPPASGRLQMLGRLSLRKETLSVPHPGIALKTAQHMR